MSDVFNDNKFTILDVWTKQWYQYQHSWQSELTHILKSRILNELEDYMHSTTIINEWCLQWPEV